MKMSDMKKHVHPEVVERLQAQFDKPLLLVTTMNNMIEGQHFEAAAQVGKQLSDQMESFRKQLDELQKEAEAFQAVETKAAAAEKKPAEAKPAPAEAKPPAPAT